MKKQLIAALFLGLGLISLGSQPSYGHNPSDLQTLKTTGNCQNCDLSGADLSNANFKNANLYGSNLSNSNLTNAKFIDSDLRSVNFSGAIINNTNVYGTQIAISSLSQTQNSGLIFKKPEAEVLVEKTGLVLTTPSPSISDSFVSLSNEAGYVAEYTLFYMTEQTFGSVKIPMPKVEKGTISLGFGKKLDIPKEAKNIFFKVQALGHIGGPVIDQTLSAGEPACFKVWGTVFNPQSAKNTCSSF